LNKIVFKFNYKINNCKLIWYILIYLIYIITILLIFIALILCLETSQFSYDLTNNEIFSTLNDKFENTVVNETLNNVTKPCIFNPFIKMFSSTSYFSSYFIPADIRVDIKYFNLPEYIYFKQFSILDNNYFLFIEYVNNS
jgi:hypothetical protein